MVNFGGVEMYDLEFKGNTILESNKKIIDELFQKAVLIEILLLFVFILIIYYMYSERKFSYVLFCSSCLVFGLILYIALFFIL